MNSTTKQQRMPGLPRLTMIGCCALIGAAWMPAMAQAPAQPAPAAATATPAAPVKAKAKSRAKAAPRQPAAAEERPARIVDAPFCVNEVTRLPTAPVAVGKSTLLRLPAPIVRRTLGDDGVVQVRLLSPQVLYLIGIRTGGTNMILQERSGRCSLMDIVVKVEPDLLQASLHQLFPTEKITVTQEADSIALSGTVSDAMVVEQVVKVAEAYARNQNRSLVGAVGTNNPAGASGGVQVAVGGGSGRAVRDSVSAAGAQVINLMNVAAPQQVLLEVKVAEVSKSVLDRFGINVARAYSPADGSMLRFMSGIFGGKGAVMGQVGNPTGTVVGGGLTDSATNSTATGTITGAANGSNSTSVQIDAAKNDGLVKILAEPTIMAVSGQEGSFLAGGKILIPVVQSSGSGQSVSLEEKEYGVSIRFTPTVLAEGRINLVVRPEVSELNQSGVGVTAPGITGTSILPSFTTRKASTTVQLYDGQSFAIGGLIKNNVTANLNAFPFLGEIPVLGALFRSTNFQSDKTELLFVITPHLVKPLNTAYKLPTDNYIEPSRGELFLGGKLEGKPKESKDEKPAPATSSADTPSQPTPPASGGFEVK
jgi:pilus assembly protein CpaC